MEKRKGHLSLNPKAKKAIIAVIVTAVVAIVIIQLAVPPSSAQSVSLTDVPSTLVLGHTYNFYVTVNLQNGAKIYPSSTITLSVYNSKSALVAAAEFNGTGSPISTGGFLQSVSVYNGTPTNVYGYGGTQSGYLSYKVAVDFLSGGAVGAGQFSMGAAVKINATSPTLNSAPAVFSVASSPNTFPIVPIFIAADLVVIGVVVWVIMTMRRKR